MIIRIVSPMNTCAPCRPVRPKKVAANAVSLVLNPIRLYSITWMHRNVSPSPKVSTSPACRPRWLPFLIEVSAQCIEKLEVTSSAVLMPATNAGSWYGDGGHCPSKTRC